MNKPCEKLEDSGGSDGAMVGVIMGEGSSGNIVDECFFAW